MQAMLQSFFVYASILHYLRGHRRTPSVAMLLSFFNYLLYLFVCVSSIVSGLCLRKYTLLLNNVLVVVGVVFQSFAVHPIMFIIGRFIVGINAGACGNNNNNNKRIGTVKQIKYCLNNEDTDGVDVVYELP